jgi:energy-coupling factor transport system ATP-binding protein
MVFQRPESQVLGVRVRDDVVWGMANAAGVDVAELLELVGLDGFGDRETSTLSGGELQRLAIAAALARRPALLVSDESTAMLDRTGRRDLTRLLRQLPARGTAVVHVTHHMGEAATADVVVALAGGRLVTVGSPLVVLGGEAGAAP